MNTAILYLYRDADNYKKQNYCVVEGVMTAEEESAIVDSLFEGELFIPSAVGMPEVRFDDITEADGPWFEMMYKGFLPTYLPANIDVTARELAERFIAMKGKWETVASQVLT